MISGSLFTIQSTVALVFALAVLAILLFAFLDAVTRPAGAFVAADKVNKQFWVILLGVALLAHVLLGGILTLVAIIAGLVYVVDTRPAVRAITRR